MHAYLEMHRAISRLFNVSPTYITEDGTDRFFFNVDLPGVFDIEEVEEACVVHARGETDYATLLLVDGSEEEKPRFFVLELREPLLDGPGLLVEGWLLPDSISRADAIAFARSKSVENDEYEFEVYEEDGDEGGPADAAQGDLAPTGARTDPFQRVAKTRYAGRAEGTGLLAWLRSKF